MEKLEIRRLDSATVLMECRNAISDGDEGKVVDTLEELLKRGVFLKSILDCFFAKIESHRLKVGDSMTNTIANTILCGTRVSALIKGSATSSLWSQMQDLRAFAEIVSSSDSSKEAIYWYKDRFGELRQSGR